jgi:hypothetical protein
MPLRLRHTYLKRYATKAAELVSSAPSAVRDVLSGPIRVNSVRYAQLEAEKVAHIESPRLMILADGMLVAHS